MRNPSGMLRLVGIIYVLKGILFAGALSVMSIFVVIGYATDSESSSLSLVLIVSIALAVILISFVPLAIAIGLLQRRKRALAPGRLLGVLSLIGFPIGTAIGAFSLWVLYRPEVSRLFDPSSPLEIVTTPSEDTPKPVILPPETCIKCGTTNLSAYETCVECGDRPFRWFGA